MSEITFQFGEKIIRVIVNGDTLVFFDVGENSSGVPEFNKEGTFKEFPDLKDDLDWQKKAALRLKEHLGKIEGEMNKINYVKNELKKVGYKPLYYKLFNKGGFRQVNKFPDEGAI